MGKIFIMIYALSVYHFVDFIIITALVCIEKLNISKYIICKLLVCTW